MSNKTNLQSLNSEYSALIETLRGKAAGGGSVETCTVEIQGSTLSAGIFDVCYITITSEGKLQYKYERLSQQSCSLQCVCNSCLAVRFVNSGSSDIVVSNAEIVQRLTNSAHVFGLQASANQTVVITNTLSEKEEPV